MHIADKDLVSQLALQAEAPQLVAAVYARVSTRAGFTHWLGPLGNYLLARPAARAAAHRKAERTEMPLDAAVVLGLEPQAMHIWSADPMMSQVNDHLGSVLITRIATMSAKAGKSWWALTITFADDESLDLEARGDVSGFVAAFGKHQNESTHGDLREAEHNRPGIL